MTTAEALTAVKNRISITGSTWDTQLTDFFDAAVDRLYPLVQKEIDPQVTSSITLDDYGEATVDLATLSTPITDARSVESTTGNHWSPVDSVYRHGTKLRCRGLGSTVTQLRIYGLKPYVVADAAVDLPERLEQPVVWFMISEFYSMLAGSKKDMNVYFQQSSGRAIEDLRAEADYFEEKAMDYIERHAQLYGA